MNDKYGPYIAEAFGTACLVLLGCASVAIAGNGAALPLGAMPIALAFGLTVTFLIYSIGPVSGCHINPAITVGLWAANRFPGTKVIGYVASQLVGGVLGAGILLFVLQGKSGGYDATVLGLGQTGWAEYSVATAFVSEFLATFIFMVVILGCVGNVESKPLAGLSIGVCLFVLISGFLNISGGSLNPARSIGPAIFVGGTAISQLWLFIVAPTLGAILAGVIFRKA